MGQPPEGKLLAWIDLEMTGLDPERDRILELACLLTDYELKEIAAGPELAVHQPEAVLAAMDAWNREHHAASGLLERVGRSSLGEADAEEQLLAFVSRHCPRGTAPLAGNSVHQDRRFLARHMPRLESWFHYRNVDVSSVKELVRHWYPEAYAARPAKRKPHRSLDDLRESIAELRYYRETVFRR